MSRFDICKCGDSEKALEQAEKIVRSMFMPNGDLCLVWAAMVSSCVDAILQEVECRKFGEQTQVDILSNAWYKTEQLRSHIEVVACSVIVDTANRASDAG